MNTRIRIRLRLAVAASTAMLLILLAGLVWQSGAIGGPQPTAHAVGHEAPGATPSAGPGNGGDSGPESLEQVASRDHGRKLPPEAQGARLRDVASQKGPGDRRSSKARNRTEGLTERRDIKPEEVLGDVSRRAPGGCLSEYGEDGQCLPAVPPSMAKHVQEMKDAGLDPNTMEHRWTCAEVREYFSEGIKVRSAGKDPQQLDANKDGVACGPGD
ncbi:hypothetical protein [uncultured Kocuria sp.]|uniref:hypothetical protein n=1 Tax=uncultured Kocuria sp. TaxID=259305 RepID=UPI00260667D7|nr:hypothetical protein [uncultured Kocuria sp.]